MSSKLTTMMLFFIFVTMVHCITTSKSSTAHQGTDTTSVDVRTIPRGTLEAGVRLCGDGIQQSLFCTCSDDDMHSADCKGEVKIGSGRYFRYIPSLPKDIERLKFMFNHLKTVGDKSFFLNVTYLDALDLSHNSIVWVSAGVFDLMPNLTELTLSSNPLSNLEALRNVLATPSLLIVDAGNCQFPSFGDDFLGDVDFSNVDNLELDENRGMNTGVFNLSPLCRLKKLKYLSLAYNSIKKVVINCVFKSLTDLILRGNFLPFLPTCDLAGQSFFPELTQLVLYQNRARSIVKEVSPRICLPKLRYLDLDQSVLAYDSFDAGRFPSLQRLRLNSLEYFNLKAINLGMSAFNNSPVEDIDMSQYPGPFVKVKEDTFSTCRNITIFKLDGARFSGVSDEKFHSLFGHLPLKGLSLRRTDFSAVSPRMFSSLTLLTVLDLSSNKIVYIPDGTFDGAVNLRTLLLNDNQIQTIGPHTFSDHLRKNFDRLDMSPNPFVCSCELLWFKAWLSSSHLNSGSKCSNRPVRVVDFVLPEQVCLMSPEVSGYIIEFCTIFILTLTSFLLLVSYRWHLRLLLYEAFRGRDDGARQRRLLQNNFDYDVFVSYAHKDLPWVRRHLMPELEGRLGLRLCIHERDFIAGNNIVDNIAESVQRSKKVLMVFSNHFVLSQWCQFELVYCLRHVMDYDDMLIIVCVDDVASRDMTTSMMAVLKTTTFIQWAGYDDAIRAFWGRVQIALREILDREHRV